MLPGHYIGVSKQMSDQINRIAKMCCGRPRCLVILKKIEDVYFFINIIIFRHLEPEIALAISSSKWMKNNRDNLAA